MDVVRRAVVAAAVGGAVLVGGPVWAQEAPPPEPGGEQVSDTPTSGIEAGDPCAPDDSGATPPMCQSEPAPEPAPVEEEVCPAQPVEPGDGVVSDGDQGVAVGEPAPGTEPDDGTGPGLEPAPVPAEGDRAAEEPVAAPVGGPGELDEDGLVCAYGTPVSGPSSGVGSSVSAGPGAAAGAGGQESVAVAGQLPSTGPRERLLALTALGSALVLTGAGATVAGRRREVQPG